MIKLVSMTLQFTLIRSEKHEKLRRNSFWWFWKNFTTGGVSRDCTNWNREITCFYLSRCWTRRSSQNPADLGSVGERFGKTQTWYYVCVYPCSGQPSLQFNWKTNVTIIKGHCCYYFTIWYLWKSLRSIIQYHWFKPLN